MTNNQLTENSVNQLLNSVRLARDNAERADNRVDHSFYYALTIALEELQERRKAAMDSEPVATLDVQSGRPDGNRFALASLEAEAVAYMIGGHYLMHAQDPKVDNYTSAVPLYTAPPMPVSVPDDVMAAIQKVARIRLDLNEFDGDKRGIAESLGEAEEALIEVVNRRAAMLQAEPVTTANKLGNSPVIPDTWIPVSERMPEVGVKVLCFPVEDEPIHASFNGQLWLQDISWSVSDEIIDNVISCNVTHWMPLPDAPQEVK